MLLAVCSAARAQPLALRRGTGAATAGIAPPRRRVAGLESPRSPAASVASGSHIPRLVAGQGRRGCVLVSAGGGAPEIDPAAAALEEEVEEEQSGHDVLKMGSKQSSDIDVEVLLSRVTSKRLNLQPAYQRKYIWTLDKASRLVETVCLNGYIPPVVLHADENMKQDVVDGQQRITTLKAFKNGCFDNGDPFKLQGLQQLPQLNGKAYADLPRSGPSPSQQAFGNFTLTSTCFQSMSQEAILRLYEDTNCGSDNLNFMQVLRVVYSGDFIRLLDNLAKNPRLQQIRGAPGPPAGPCKFESDCQLILRFFTLHRYRSTFSGDLKKNMRIFCSENRHPGEHELAKMHSLFVETLDAVYEAYGPTAFRLWRGRGWEKKLSLGLYDASMLTFADLVQKKSAPKALHSAMLVEDIKRLSEEEQVFQTERFSAGRFRDRLSAFGRRMEVQGLLGPTRSRQFQQREELARKLHRAQGGKPIQDWQDAHLDHRVPFSQGGASSQSNAQLLHKHCNLSKGARSDDEARARRRRK